MNKPKVGDKLFLVDIGNRARLGSKQRTCEVAKVGRKYFTVIYGEKPHYAEVEFEIETLRQRTKYIQEYALYESEQAWLDSLEATRVAQEISNAFRYTGYKAFTLAQLKDVCKVIGIKLEES